MSTSDIPTDAVSTANGFINSNNTASQLPSLPIPLPKHLDLSVTSVNVALKTDALCPAGYICNETHQASCTDIRNASIELFGFGDIHAGAYCPLGSPYYLNCEIGYYCPDPSTRILCPAGYFCPHKTLEPQLRCGRCPEGAETLYRDVFGFVLIAFFFLVGIVYVGTRLFRQRVAALRAQFERLGDRVLSTAFLQRRVTLQQERLAKIRPKLEIVNQRLFALLLSRNTLDFETEEGESNFRAKAREKVDEACQISNDGAIFFDVRKVFDLIDADGNGVLSYEELNSVLQFDEKELRDFVHRMNSVKHGLVDTDENHVSRQVFVRFFIEVLEETSNFKLTKEEAGARWDEIASLYGTTPRREIPYEAMYYSPTISSFLSDVQINELIQQFKKVKVRRNREASVLSFFGNNVLDVEGISRDVFCKYYPTFLEAILLRDSQNDSSTENLDRMDGIDIAFKNLSLSVQLSRDKSVNVVENVTGRLRKGTMTALLGGSGAGKTSLLNALCGRAHYGEVKGEVWINGNKASVEDFADSIGFVPQDDIVYAELTVRENLMYSGRFRLPKGTPLSEIEEQVNVVLAQLGLARKSDSIVGDVTRRGLSGGEKKRVNLGLELMAKPAALFLDEPTSGLDASSALTVMSSLRQLVQNQGVTVCSVIHQPRKFIFDLFDSVVLLGSGGRMVYHGTVEGCSPYFSSLGYSLPPGESVADWLIDISTGRIAADADMNGAATRGTGAFMLGLDNTVIQQGEEPLGSYNPVQDATIIRPTYDSERFEPSFLSQRSLLLADGDPNTIDEAVTNGKLSKADDDAVLRREVLYASWIEYFDSMSAADKEIYNHPPAGELPKAAELPPFGIQFWLQLKRMFLLGWRNRVTKVIECGLLVIAVVVISGFNGTVSLTKNNVPFVPFEAFIAGQETVLPAFFQPLFAFAILGTDNYLRYALSLGVISSVLIALTSVKAITEKRLEFFREISSGYSSSAYFLAVNVYTTIDQGVQVLFAAVIAQWLRATVSGRGIFYLAFFMLAWNSISWSLLIPLISPPSSTLVILGTFMAFFGLLFSGGLPPIKYGNIYHNSGLAVLSAFVATPRFFAETLAVSDLQCLPPNSGFTISDDAFNFPEDRDSFSFISLGQNDSGVTEQNCDGWYWGMIPAFLVGLTVRFLALGAIHTCQLSKQAKKPFWFQLRHRGTKKLHVAVGLYCATFVVLFSVTIWSILRKT